LFYKGFWWLQSGYKAATKYHGVAAEEFVKKLTILSGETITGVYDTAKGGLNKPLMIRLIDCFSCLFLNY
jgi:hypothetical protein